MTLIEDLKGMGKYIIKVKCKNCNKTSTIKVQKGITIKEHMENLEGKGGCPYCGCDTIIPSSSEKPEKPKPEPKEKPKLSMWGK